MHFATPDYIDRRRGVILRAAGSAYCCDCGMEATYWWIGLDGGRPLVNVTGRGHTPSMALRLETVEFDGPGLDECERRRIARGSEVPLSRG
jgi:hypothetical protein